MFAITSTFRPLLSIVCKVPVRSLHHDFQAHVLQVAADPKKIVHLGRKELSPLKWEASISEEILRLKHHCVETWPENWQKTLDESVERWYKRASTHCFTTAGAVHRTALTVLFKNGEKPFSDSKSAKLPPPAELAIEMRKNELKLYRFVLSKGIFHHIFTVVKFPTSSKPIYSLYQSYLAHYTLHDYMNSSSFQLYDFDQINSYVLEPLAKMNAEFWTAQDYLNYEKLAIASMESHEKRSRSHPEPCKVTIEMVS